MISELTYAKEMMYRGGYTLVLCKKEAVHTSDEGGLAPLAEACGGDWSGATAADRVVGKAAALLFAYMKVKAVFAGTISKAAMRVFAEHGIEYAYDSFTGTVLNSEKTDLCEYEKAVWSITDPEKAAEILI